ncbi:MAG: M1 family metallopeptidase [Ignavibacteriales bacterium]
MKILKIIVQILFLFTYFWWQEFIYFYVIDNYFPQPKPSYSNIDVLQYKIEIRLLPREKKINAKIQIHFNPIKHKKLILLDFADGFNVSSVKLNGLDTKYEYENNRIKLASENEIHDSSKIEIEYSGKPSQKKEFGLIFGEDNGEYFVYTINEASEARTWLPCNDSPDDKAMLDIRITNDEKFISLSNGNLIDSSNHSGLRTYHWKSEYPITTYNIAIYSGDFKRHIIADKRFDIVYYVPENIASEAARDFSMLPYLIKLNENYFGEYPFIKEKIGLTINLWNRGAAENQTIIGIGKNFIKGDNSNLSLINHELAHAWWGNSISIKSWKDIWLIEGFARYSEILLAKDYFKDNIKSYYNLLDIFSSVSFNSSLYNPKGFIFDDFIYDKSARVLMMLSDEVGDSVFLDMVKEFHKRYKYSNVSTQDFQNFVEKYSLKNLTDFFNQWIYKGVGLPVIRYDYKFEEVAGKTFVTIELEQIQTDYKKYKLKLPVAFICKSQKKSQKSGVSQRLKFEFRMNSRKMKIIQQFDCRVSSIDINPEKKILARFIRKH